MEYNVEKLLRNGDYFTVLLIITWTKTQAGGEVVGVAGPGGAEAGAKVAGAVGDHNPGVYVQDGRWVDLL